MAMNPRAEFGSIGVLMGGPSAEREISLRSGKAVYEALKQSGLEVVAIDVKTDNLKELIGLIKPYNINCAFVALHGRFGEDGQIQKLLEILKIPYTGSGVEASRLAMDKIASRKIFESAGLRIPRYKVIDKPRSSLEYKIMLKEGRGKPRYSRNSEVYNILGLPLVIKPATQGSSIGLSIIDKEQNLDKAVALAFSFDKKIIIEEYIRGREMTVGILDGRALPVIEIIPKKRFFDYEAKYQPGLTSYIVPARLEERIAKRLKRAALSAHKLLGCFGCSRVDMILNKEDLPVVLEVNSIPGLTETSLLPKAAKSEGIEFAELCLRLIKLAYEKTQAKSGD
jgi:D-alanine-D-alanine ligase